MISPELRKFFRSLWLDIGHGPTPKIGRNDLNPQSMKYMNCCFVFFKQGRRDTYHFNFLATSDVQPLVLLAEYRKFFLSCLYYQI